MGNEFGHPEWVDFPRQGNNWSYHYARRQWHLRDDPELKYHFLADFDEAMLNLMGPRDVIGASPAIRLHLNDGNKVFAFGRSDLFFFFNFHPAKSYSDYRIETLPGPYEWVLDTDEGRFGGHQRVQAGQRYHTIPLVEGNQLRHFVSLYLPARCALVLRRSRPCGRYP
jgi:1,4-alpha-glucan branching enzyme